MPNRHQIVHYTAQDGHLHPMAAHLGKVTQCIIKAHQISKSVHFQIPSRPIIPINGQCSKVLYSSHQCINDFKHSHLCRYCSELGAVKFSGFLGEQKIEII